MSLWSWWRGRTVKLTDGAFWAQWFGGSNYAGKTVTPETSLQLAAFWACVRLISETVATLPLNVYVTDRNGENKKADKSHLLYGLLHEPNADQTACEYWEGVLGSVCIVGNHVSEKLYSGDRLIGLKPFSFDAVNVSRNKDGALVYRVTDRGKSEELPEDKVFHVRGFGGGDLGLSPVTYARQTLGIALATDEAVGKTFSQGLRASGFFSSPTGKTLTPEQRTQFTTAFIDPYVGNDAAAKVGLLEGGFEFKPINVSPRDAEMILNRKFNVEEICRWLRVPPILVGHAGEGQTMWGSGVEQVMIAWLTLGLRPYLKRVEERINKSLVPPGERTMVFAEYAVEGLLRADTAARGEFYSKMVQNGIYTRNFVRGLENQPPMIVDGADSLTVQSQLLPIELLGKVQTAPARAPSLEGNPTT